MMNCRLNPVHHLFCTAARSADEIRDLEGQVRTQLILEILGQFRIAFHALLLFQYNRF